MPESAHMPTVSEILSEWTLDDVDVATKTWTHGLERYKDNDLENRIEMVLAADEMGVALAWFLSRRSEGRDASALLPDADVVVIAWNVLVAALGGDSEELITSGVDRPLRATVTVVRELGCQSHQLGGSGLMAEIFEDSGSCSLIERALGLWSRSDSGEPLSLQTWFEGKPKTKPRLSLPEPIEESGDQPASMSASAESKFGKSKLLGSARATLQKVDPATIQHGLDSMHGALTASKVAKTDRKTGKLRIKKTGLVRAAIRPGKTIRKAIDGAAISDHFRSMAEENAEDHPA